MSYVILDLDNCIADDAWRIPRINWSKKDPGARYHVYHSLAAFDRPGNEDLFSDGSEAIIFTARPALYRPATEEWLRRHNVPFKHLVMRNNNDHRKSVDLKREMLHWLPELYNIAWSSVAAAYDDREDVVEMFRRNHINAHVRAIHGVCAYTNPNQPKAS